MTARDRVMKKEEGKVTTVSFGLKMTTCGLLHSKAFPLSFFLVAQSMQKWIKKPETLERPGMKLLAIINLANKYSSGYSQQVQSHSHQV